VGRWWWSVSSKWRLPSAKGENLAFLVVRPENQFFYNRECLKYLSKYISILNSPTTKRVLSRRKHITYHILLVPGHGYFSKQEQFDGLPCEKGEFYMEFWWMSCQERNGQLCKFCENDETTSATFPTRRPYPNYGKLPNFHHLSRSATPATGREPDDSQPLLFEESELIRGDSEALRKFQIHCPRKACGRMCTARCPDKNAMIKAHIGSLLYDSM